MSSKKAELEARKKALADATAAREEAHAALELEAMDALEIVREVYGKTDPNAIFDYLILGKGEGALAIVLRQPSRPKFQALSEAIAPKANLSAAGKVQMEKPSSAIPVNDIAQDCVRWVTGTDPRADYVWTTGAAAIERALDKFPGCADDITGTVQLLARGETQGYAGK